MATDSFTSSAAVVTATSGAPNDFLSGNKVVSSVGFWGIRVAANGVTITKASTLGGAQSAPTFPVTRAAALDLAQELMKAVT
jgi:hypothetical protein